MANKIFKGVKFPGMDDYYVLPEAVITKNEDGIIEIESYMPGESNIVIDKTLSAAGAVAEAKAVGDALQNKVSVVEGSRLMTQEEANKLAKLVIDEDGNVGSTDIINVGNAEGILAIAHGGTGNNTGYIQTGAKEGSSIGNKSTIEGANNIGSGESSHVEGASNTASGDYSHAEGVNSEAGGDYSHAEGVNTYTSGIASHAEGANSEATGGYSHAEGNFSQAKGEYSHAEGQNTIASGESSHAEGRDTLASSSDQHVQGRYNIEDTDNTYAHIVGNGSSTTRSNAHTLDWEGNAWFAGAIDCEDTATTLANLGAAPAKFGLNNDFVTTTNAADFDGYKTNGWYRYVNNNAQTLVSGFNVYYAVVRVDSYSDNAYIVQTMYPMNYPSCTLRRYYHLSYGTWSKWAWENPPLNNDVEYFTTELIKNVQIYKKKDSTTGKIQYRIAGEGTWNDYAGLLGQTDYVVANGTSGVWSYWKFNSGLCIAMGRPTVTWGTQTQVITGQYRSGTALDLTGIFTAVMGGTCSNVHRYVNCFVIPSGSTSAELWATTAALADAELYSKTPMVVLFGKWK